MPKPGKAPFILFHLVNGPVYLHASLPGRLAIFLLVLADQTHALFHGSFDRHIGLVAALAKVLMSKPVGFGGAILQDSRIGRWLGQSWLAQARCLCQPVLRVSRVSVESSTSLTTVDDGVQLQVSFAVRLSELQVGRLTCQIGVSRTVVRDCRTRLKRDCRNSHVSETDMSKLSQRDGLGCLRCSATMTVRQKA